MIADGKKIARLIKANLKKEIKDKKIHKKMAIFYVGQNKVIEKFINLKKSFGKSVGAVVTVFKYDEKVLEKDFISDIKEKSKDFDGIVVQLPLPSHMDKKRVLNSVPKEKDIDVLGEKKYKEFKSGDMRSLPPVAGAIFEIISFYNLDLENKKVVIVGEGLLVGKPTNDLFSLIGLHPVCINKETKDKLKIIKSADILVCGIGKANFIKKNHIKKGVILFDAGSSSEGGVIFGDIAKDCMSKSSFFSMVPGGIGPITVAILFRNMLYN